MITDATEGPAHQISQPCLHYEWCHTDNRASLFSKSSLARLQEFRNSSICLYIYEIKRKNLFKSTRLTSTFTCPRPSGSGKRRALYKQCLKLGLKSCRPSCLESQIINIKMIKLKKNLQKVPGPPPKLSASDRRSCENFQHWWQVVSSSDQISHSLALPPSWCDGDTSLWRAATTTAILCHGIDLG